MKKFYGIIIGVVFILLLIPSVFGSLTNHYNFENQANDQVGTRHLTNQGADYIMDTPTYNTSGTGGTYSADFVSANTDYMEDDDVMTITSMSVWVKLETAKSGDDAIKDTVVGESEGANNLYLGGTLGGVSGETIVITNDDASGGAYASFSMPAETWFHLVVLWDGDSWEFYYNTEHYAGTEWGGWSEQDLMLDLFYVGRRNSGTYANCSFDELKIYDHALSSAEISNLYNYGTITAPPVNSIPYYQIIDPQNNTPYANTTQNLEFSVYDADAGTNLSTFVYLKSNASGSYDLVWFGIYPNNTIVNVTNLTGLVQGTTYNWYVNVTDDNGADNLSGVYNFRVSDFVDPVITLNYPTIDNNSRTGNQGFNISADISDNFLDAINITVNCSNNTALYNNFSSVHPLTTINVTDFINLTYCTFGNVHVEVCARDSLENSPVIEGKINVNRQTNTSGHISLFTDNKGTKIKREIRIYEQFGISKNPLNDISGYDLKVYENFTVDGKHLKADYIFNKPVSNMFYIGVSFECIDDPGCNMIYMDDRNHKRIIDSKYRYYFSFDDAVKQGYKVEFSSLNGIVTAYLKYDAGTFEKLKSKVIIDPITGGLNTICAYSMIEYYNNTTPVISTTNFPSGFASIQQALFYMFILVFWFAVYLSVFVVKGQQGGVIGFLNLLQMILGIWSGANFMTVSVMIGFAVSFISVGTFIGLIVKNK